MKALVCIKDGYSFTKDQIVSIVEDNHTSYLISGCFAILVDIPESVDMRFLKAVYLDAVPEKYKKDNIVYDSCPQVEDDSWTLVAATPEVLAVEGSPEVLAVEGSPAIPAIEAVPEHWSKDGEVDVTVDPEDVTWTHHPAIEAQDAVPAVEAVAYKAAVAAVEYKPVVPQHWIKPGQTLSLIKPMMNDPTYEVIPAIPAGYVIEEKFAEKNIFIQDQVIVNQVALGAKIEACCKELMNCIIGYNLLNLTSEQITQMQEDYSDVNAAITGFRPNVAKELIAQKTGFSELKQNLLGIISKHGF